MNLAAILSAQTARTVITIRCLPAGNRLRCAPEPGCGRGEAAGRRWAGIPLLHRTGEAAPNLQLPAPGAVVGRAVYYDGTELPEDVRIKAMRMGFAWGESVHATPDATGELRLEPLAAGPWGSFVDSSPSNSAPVNVEVPPGAHTKPSYRCRAGRHDSRQYCTLGTGDLVKGGSSRSNSSMNKKEIVPLAVRFEAGDINLRARPGVVSVHVRGLNCTVIDAPKAQWLLAHGAHYPDFTISVLPHTRLSGRVFRAGGAPAAGAAVRSMGFHVRTAASGDFTLSTPALPPNKSQRFHATHAWTETEFGHLDVSVSPASGLTIQLAGRVHCGKNRISPRRRTCAPGCPPRGNELRAVTWTGGGRFDGRGASGVGVELIQGGEPSPPDEPGETRTWARSWPTPKPDPFPQPKINITPL